MITDHRLTKNSSSHKAQILAILNKEGEQTKTFLASRLNVSRPTIYHHIEILKTKGLIEEKEPARDQKGSPVLVSFKLSPKFKEMVLKMILRIKSFEKKKLAPSTKFKIFEELDYPIEDLELVFDFLGASKAIGITITNQGIKLKKELQQK